MTSPLNKTGVVPHHTHGRQLKPIVSPAPSPTSRLPNSSPKHVMPGLFRTMTSSPMHANQPPMEPEDTRPTAHHPQARTGTTFQGVDDELGAAFRAEYLKSLESDKNEEEKEETDQNTSILSDEEIEARLGILSTPIISSYTQTHYASIEEDWNDWESNSHQHRTPHLPPVTASLHGLDIERSVQPPVSSIMDAATVIPPTNTTSPPKHLPSTLQYRQIVELEKRTTTKLPTQINTQVKQPVKSHKKRRQTLRAVELKNTALASSASTPNLVLPVPPGVQFAAPPTKAALNYIDAAYATSYDDVLSPRTRYDQLGRACAEILPSPPPVDTTPLHHIVPDPESQKSHPPDASSPLSRKLHPLSAASHTPLTSLPNSPKFSPPTFSKHSSIAAAPLDSPASGSPTSPPNLNAVGFAAAIEQARLAKKRQQQAADASHHIKALQKRDRLKSQFLREIERASGITNENSFLSSGLGQLSLVENQRLTVHRASAANLLKVGSGGAVGEVEFSSAAVLAMRELHGMDDAVTNEKRPKTAATATARTARSRSISPERQAHIAQVHSRVKDFVDPLLAAVAASAHEVNMVHSTTEPTTAPEAAHKFMRTHAMHHHLTLPAKQMNKSKSSAAILSTTPKPAAGENDSTSLLDAPLPSHSRTLQLQSPSCKPGWVAPALRASELSESIYHATLSLSGLISDGEGVDALERHLNLIRPQHIADEAKKTARAAAAVEQMQAYAAELKGIAIRARQDANIAILRVKEERRKAEKKAREEAAEAALKVSILQGVEMVAAMKAEDAAAAATASSPASPTGSTKGSGIKKSLKVEIPAAPVQKIEVVKKVDKLPSPKIVPTASTATTAQPTSTSTATSDTTNIPSPSNLSPKKRSNLWARVRELTTGRHKRSSPTLELPPLSLEDPLTGERFADPEAHEKFVADVARATAAATTAAEAVKQSRATILGSAGRKRTNINSPPMSPTQPIASATTLPSKSVTHSRPPQPKPSSYSVHRISEGRTATASSYGPFGENLIRTLLIPPATFAAGNILDTSVAASDERHTAAEKKEQQRADYTNVLARLYQRVTPQMKRLRRLDHPTVTADDLRRVVEESLGSIDVNARKRYSTQKMRG